MSVMRAKMRINSITKYDSCEILALNGVGKSTGYPDDGSDENNTYAKFTPSADLKITIANPALIGKFIVGDAFYVDFTPVP